MLCDCPAGPLILMAFLLACFPGDPCILLFHVDVKSGFSLSWVGSGVGAVHTPTEGTGVWLCAPCTAHFLRLGLGLEEGEGFCVLILTQ